MHPSLLGMAAYKQFIVYRVEPSSVRPGKTDKFPIDHRTGRKHDAHDPSIWLDAETAHQVVQAWGSPYGVGFVFTENDPFWFLDIDSCLTEAGWSPIAQQLCSFFTGAAVEISQSGTGLHIFGSGKPPVHGCTNKSVGLEFYHAGRFAALTGTNAIGDCTKDFTSALPALVATYFPPDISQTRESVWTSAPVEEWNGPTDDPELIRRASLSHSASSAFGNKASFSDLWTANGNALARAYPDGNGRLFDCSAADSALAQHLAFWTGKDCERIRRLMLQSGLVRDKWEREDYLPRTILGVVARQVEVLQDKKTELALSAPPPPAGSGVMESKVVEGGTFLSGSEQMEMFSGCLYVRDQHRALIPGGRLIKPEQFKVHFGGFSFQIDAENSKATRDAWEAWSQSQLYRIPKVDGICFKPQQAPGVVLERNGQYFVNTFFPLAIARKQGDIAPFMNHLAKVLPNERDRLILLSYMAACVQHQGIKFQWAPLLQGVEGNGKTLFTRCVAEAVGRRYVHWPKASKLAKEFNAWMVGKVFYAVEDIYVPDARREVIEELKPMITGGDGLEIEAKGVDQRSDDICGNFMFNSNHKDAVKKTANDRRFCLFFSAQQAVEDLVRDGMTGDYFPDLYNWLQEDGYAIVSEFLWTYQIPDQFNPGTDCQRAPFTSTTDEAIAESAGSIEQEIKEALEQGLQGFAGGWISSIWMERLLERMGLARKITHNKRREMLTQMGYIVHPALPGGRTNNVVLPDSGKPRLFVKKDSLAVQISDPAAVAKAYETANINKAVSGLPFKAHQRG